MNRSGFIEYHWTDEVNKIIFVKKTINGVGTLTAHVNLNDDAVEIISTEFAEPLDNAILDDQHDRILQCARDWERRQRPPYPKDIRWHEDGMKFKTQRESWEWASSIVYTEIGNLYDGYRTEDEKIACSLVYELTRRNTFSEPTLHVFAHNEYSHVEKTISYMVWVEPVVK